MSSSNSYRTISDVLGKEKFSVPSFQRGYRWAENDVELFIKDIGSISGNDMYCIQPLVVMKENDRCSVIDGQQRLTTAVIILSVLNYLIKNNAPADVDIQFDSRHDTTDLLKALYKFREQESENKYTEFIKSIHKGGNVNFSRVDNIDHAYIYQAYKLAYKEFTSKSERELKEYRDKLLDNTQFIWYEIPSGTTPQEVFTNFNTGKIELTDSKLIKADILMKTDNKDKQIVISEKWDEIENALHEDSLWAFIPHEKQYNTEYESSRIDELFKYLIYSLDKKPEAYNKYSDRKLYQAISEWMGKFESEDNDLKIYRIWSEISKIFSGLYELYHNDNKIYNMAALYVYLCRNDKEKEDVYKSLAEVLKENRGSREKKLKELIYNKFRNSDKKNSDKKTEIRKKITSSFYTKSSNIVDILTVYNIALLNQTDENGSRYDFIAHNKGNSVKTNDTWNREHIFAQNMCCVSLEETEEWGNKEFGMAKNIYEILAGTAYIEYVIYLFYSTKQAEIDKKKDDDKNKDWWFEKDAKGRPSEFQCKYGENRENRQLNLKWEYGEEDGKLTDESEESLNELIKYAKDVNKDSYYKGDSFNSYLCKAAVSRHEAISCLKYLKERENLIYQKKQKNKQRDEETENVNEKTEELDKKIEELNKKIKGFFAKQKSDKDESESNDEQNSQNKSNDDEKSPFVRHLNDNSMGNMALLRSKNNKDVGNHPFYEKKKDIMKNISNGSFVPFETQMVFMGAFADDDAFWLPGSRLKYLKDIVEKISKFLI